MTKRKHMPLRLQFFAEDGAQDTPSTPETENTPSEQPDTGTPEKTFTQSEVDRLIAQRLSRAQKENEKKVEAARTEAEKLAQMTAEEKAQHQQQQLEKQLADREATLTRRELRAQALETLAERGLPKELADMLHYEDSDQCNASLQAVEKVFRSAVEIGVTARLKGAAPHKGDSIKDDSQLSDEEYFNRQFKH